MAVLQRSTKVRIPLDKAEQCWTEFTAPSRDVRSGNGEDPGTVFFTKVDDETTEVTIQLDPTGIADDDELVLNKRVDSFLERFKGFVENR